MADKLPPAPEGGFHDGEGLKAWLTSLPKNQIKPVALVLSCRAALRVLPNLHHEYSVDKAGTHFAAAIILQSLRANLISRIALKSPTDEVIYAASSPANLMSSAMHESKNPLARSALSAAGYAAIIASANSGPSAPDFAIRTARAATGSSHSIRATSSASYADIWEAISWDSESLISGTSPQVLLSAPLWTESLWPKNKAPVWWIDARSEFLTGLARRDQHTAEKNVESSEWMVWIEWYDDISRGLPLWGMPFETSRELEKRIALGDGRAENFWDREPEEVNREIAEWIEEARRNIDLFEKDKDPQSIFLSYTASDLETTKRIGTIIEEAGTNVFAQYKDMPPGSNFVAEMNEGLGGMNRFVPIYSPEYMDSDICQAEWNTAYYRDPLGKKRLIVGFMIKPCTVLPLMQQTVYVPLYNLTEAKSREAIIDALTWDGTQFNAAKSRKIASDYATPLPIITETGLIGIEDTALEAPFIDDELATLPESMRKELDRIIASLKAANCSPMLLNSLQDYKTELLLKGASPNLADLNRCDGIIRAELKDAEEYQPGWYGSGMKTAFSHLFEMHENMRQHFPLMMLRDFSIERTSTNPEKFDDAALGAAHQNFAARAKDAFEDGQASEEFHATMELRERQRRDIESLRTKPQPPHEDIFLSPDDRVTPQEIKKRWLFDQSGTLDKLVSRAAQASTVSDSETVKDLVKAAKKFLDSLWG